MHTINNVFKWSLYFSSITASIVLGGLFALWLMIEVLTLLIQL